MSAPLVAELPTCRRCGIFLRAGEIGRPLCGACLEHDVIAPIRGPLSAGLVTRGLGALVARVGLQSVGITLLFALPGFVLEHLVPDLPFAFHVIDGAITLVGELAVMVLIHDALRGRDPDLGRAFGDGLTRYGAGFLTRLVAGLFILFWMVLLIVPGLYKAAAYTLSGPIALFEATSGSNAIDQSIERTRPHMLLISASYGLLALTFAGWMALVFVAYALFVGESGDLTRAGLIDAVAELGFAVLVTLATFTQMIFYVKLTPR
jgi:hypothetical protein